MRKQGFIILAFFGLAACRSQKEVYLFTSFHEPANEGLRFLWSRDAWHWQDLGAAFIKPEVGSQKVMRDPSIVYGPDGLYHFVWTSSWKDDKGFGYAESKDLVHWSPQRFIPVMEKEPTTCNVWAPELFYDEETAQYIIVWASTIPFRFPKGEEDENNNHRLYYTTTKDFVSFSDAKLFYDPGFSVIDAEIIRRGQGDYVLVLKDNTRPNRDIKVAFAQHALGPWGAASEAFTHMYTEGPSVAKAGNDWLIYFDAYRDKKYGAVKTSDFKTFTDVSSQVSLPEGHKHGTIFKAPKKALKELQKAAAAR
ncbi:MAG: glycoside hydrolase family 43 protein [Bacteroidetes bacterium]|nr:glycoside hydrolase family 43 protein [Bacteroidota bacterium]